MTPFQVEKWCTQAFLGPSLPPLTRGLLLHLVRELPIESHLFPNSSSDKPLPGGELTLGEEHSYCCAWNQCWKWSILRHNRSIRQFEKAILCPLRLTMIRFFALFMLPISSASAAAARWQKLPVAGIAPQNCSSPAAGAIGHNICTFGGLFDNFVAFENTFCNNLFKFDVTTNAWTESTPTGSLPDPRTFAASTALGGKLFVCGGSSHDPSFFPFAAHDDLWACDSVANAWREIVATGASQGQRKGARIDVMFSQLQLNLPHLRH